LGAPETSFTDITIRFITRDLAVAIASAMMGDFATPDGRPQIEAPDGLSLILTKRDDGGKNHPRRPPVSAQVCSRSTRESRCGLRKMISRVTRFSP
jgi:hypothetical protein